MRPSESVARMVSVTPLLSVAFFVIFGRAEEHVHLLRREGDGRGERRQRLLALQSRGHAEKDESDDERAAGAMTWGAPPAKRTSDG